MSLKINGIAPIRTLSKHLQAGCFNQVRLALVRISNPLRVELSDLRVEMVLGARGWLCLSMETRAPLLSWTNFDRPPALHRPVSCKLSLYHVHAGLLSGIALESLENVLRQRLARRRSGAAVVVHRQFRCRRQGAISNGPCED